MITFIGWIAIFYVVFLLLGKIIIAHKDKDRNWYEDPIFGNELPVFKKEENETST